MLYKYETDEASILDRYLANLSVEVEPFALCMLDSGWRLTLPGPGKPVLQGAIMSLVNHVRLERAAKMLHSGHYPIQLTPAVNSIGFGLYPVFDRRHPLFNRPVKCTVAQSCADRNFFKGNQLRAVVSELFAGAHRIRGFVN